MKKTIGSMILALSLLSPAAALAKDAKTTLSVKGWHCDGCSSKTERALKKVEGVKSVESDADKGQIVIAFDDAKTSEKALVEAIKTLGYEASTAPAKKDAAKKN